MPHTSNPAIDGPAGAGVRPASAISYKARRARARDAAKQAFLDHYFKRLDPEVAASFTAEQRKAIMTMFGARGIAEHTIEARHSIPLPGAQRFYLVFLCGRDRRAMTRLHGQGTTSGGVHILWYLGLGALILVPVLGLLTVGGF